MDSRDKQPRFSIIIPTFNRATSVTQTLDSVFSQTFADFEVIVVDDGSTDTTLDTLAGITDPRLVVVSQENAGPAAARNRGMDEARGEYVSFLDSDDEWYPGFLEAADTHYKQEADSLVYGQIVVDRGVGRYWVKPDRALADDEPIYDFLYVHGGFIQTSTMVIPQHLAESVRWDEAITFGDNDQFAIDCWRTGIAFRMLSEPLVLYADVVSADALSQLPIYDGDSPKHTNFFRWMDTQRPHMSEQAWLGFQARFVSVGLARKHPLQSLSRLWSAWRAGAIGAKGVFRQLLQNYTPRLYRRITDQYVRLRGETRHALEP